MCSPQLMQDMQSAMQQYQGGGQQMQLGPVGGAAPATPMQAPQQAQSAPQPIPPQLIAALAARHAAQAHAVPAGLVNRVASSHAGGH